MGDDARTCGGSSLGELYQRGLRVHKEVESGEMSSASEEFQVQSRPSALASLTRLLPQKELLGSTPCTLLLLRRPSLQQGSGI